MNWVKDEIVSWSSWWAHSSIVSINIQQLHFQEEDNVWYLSAYKKHYANNGGVAGYDPIWKTRVADRELDFEMVKDRAIRLVYDHLYGLASKFASEVGIKTKEDELTGYIAVALSQLKTAEAKEEDAPMSADAHRLEARQVLAIALGDTPPSVYGSVRGECAKLVNELDRLRSLAELHDVPSA